ncbi:hypothetical protein [Fusobacterium hominis]|jgi:hypothetical protein|uniref:Uncharacterized protein n=1 Tax=Fusobacterium hominis TaxID=2764326 RepID=A0A7G9GY56_9FUSO|nr:hypothetical protein [Fusobacterium hominis]QNM15738.1 hypothetical protein H9Q81_02545 [Fusobacterium hominis]
MDILYYIEFSHIIILQEIEIGMETEDSLITALGCSLNKIPKKFLTDDYSYYNGNICIFRRTKKELLVAFKKYKESILKNMAEIEKELSVE